MGRRKHTREIFGLDEEIWASKRANLLGFVGRDLTGWFWRAGQQAESNENYLPCIVKLMQGRSTVELLIIRFGIERVQGLAMVEEDYLSYVINRPIDENWNREIDEARFKIYS